MLPLVIVNPNSGGGRTGRVFPKMQRQIERSIGRFDVAHTTRRAHAIDIAEAACRQGRTLLVAVGGDGTLSEVVNGRMRASDAMGSEARVAMIAQGTGGDFRKSLGMEHRLDVYLDAISSGRERAVDVGRFTYRSADASLKTHYFLNILSVGMGGLVDRLVAETPKHLGGKLAYLAASARGLVESRLGRLRVTTSLKGDARERHVVTYMLAICNGQFFGGGMQIAPMARVDSGRFEVVALGASSKLGLAIVSAGLYDGSHMRDRTTEHFGCESVSIDLLNADARSAFLLDVDGESMSGLPIKVDIMPSALVLRA